MCRAAVMEFDHVALIVLSLLSVGHSAPVTNCESLIQPVEIQGRDQLLGIWTFVAESTNIIGSQLLTKMFFESAWGKFAATNEDHLITSSYSYKMFGRCFSLSASYTVVNNTMSSERPYVSSTVLLNTGCPDCLVFSTKVTLGRSTYDVLQLLTRRRTVTAAELEEFKKQAECLNLSPPAILDSEKGLCPDATSNQETEIIDLTNAFNNMGAEVFDTFNNFFSSEGGVKSLIELISGNFPGLKQN